MSTALAGYRVLDLTRSFWAALATMLLADFGAEVVRVEDLGEAGASPSPEAWRRQRNARAGWDYEHELAQRNKLGLALRLGDERGRRVLAELAAQADALVTDWSDDALRAAGIDPQRAEETYPRLVLARGSGLGPAGPDRDTPPIDELAAARTGMMPILPQPGQPPVYPGHGAMYTSAMLAFGVAVALFHRGRTGEGQRVDASLLGGNLYGASLDLQAFLAIGGERFLRPVSRLDAGNPMSGTLYRTRDGRWVTLTMPDTDRWWPKLAEVTGLDPADPRFDTHDKRCGENRLALIALLEERFREHDADHWRAVFSRERMSADVIEDYAYPANDGQARRNRYILDLEDPSLGRLSLLGFPIFMSETPARLHRRAPCRGQHTADVLTRWLGLEEERILELESEGVVR